MELDSAKGLAGRGGRREGLAQAGRRAQRRGDGGGGRRSCAVPG